MKTLKQISRICLIAILTMLFSRCWQYPKFQITTPTPTTTYSPMRLSDGRFVFTVEFNKSVNKNTVNPGTTIMLNVGNSKNTPIDINWLNSDMQLVITTKLNHFEQESNTAKNITYQLKLFGSPININPSSSTTFEGIKSINNEILDGDYDKQPGGNFVLNGVAAIG